MRQRQLQNFLIRDKSIVWMQKRDGVTIATVQIRSIWLKLYFKEKQETKFVVMGLSPSGCVFSFSLCFIRHNFRTVFCFIFLCTCRNACGTDAVPSSLGAHNSCTSSVCGEVQGASGHPWDSNPFVTRTGKTWTRAASVAGPSSVASAGLWQT